MNPDRLSQLPVDVFIQQITYLPFKDTTLRGYCSDPKYQNKWKRLIDLTHNFVNKHFSVSDADSLLRDK
jgi:hypothetical protein